MKVYVTIGNSDGKLSHKDWDGFIDLVRFVLDAVEGEVIGEWRRDVWPYVNACFLYEVKEPALNWVRAQLKELAKQFNQDSIGFMAGESELLTPP